MKCAHCWWRQVRSSKNAISLASGDGRRHKVEELSVCIRKLWRLTAFFVFKGLSGIILIKRRKLISHWSSKTSLSQNYRVNAIVLWRRARTTLTFGYFNRYRSLITYWNALLIQVELVYFHCRKRKTQCPSVDKLIFYNKTLNQVNRAKNNLSYPTEGDPSKHSQNILHNSTWKPKIKLRDILQQFDLWQEIRMFILFKYVYF